MRKLLLVAIPLLLIAASGAQAADPCWMFVYRGTGDASAAPNVLGSDPAQTGQQRCVYYARSLTDLGKGNWWTVENDPVYGDVTRVHHDGSAGSAFNWRGYGFDDQVPPQCASHWVDPAKGSFPPGTTHEDGIACALRIKLTAFGRGNNSSTRHRASRSG